MQLRLHETARHGEKGGLRLGGDVHLLVDALHVGLHGPLGDPEGVRQRAAEKMIQAGQAARAFLDAKPASLGGKKGATAVVNGFTGSSVWHSIYAFPPTSDEHWQQSFDDFAKRFRPILKAFDKLKVNFALEVHPNEMAFDTASAQRALKAVTNHKRLGLTFDPSHIS